MSNFLVSRKSASRRVAARSSLIGLVCVAALACGPLGPIPGGRLRGDVQPVPASWEAISEIETFQLETRPADPHSINIWTGVLDGKLYVATSLILGTDVPAERDWVKHVEADPRVRLRADGNLYELRATRILDAAEAQRARAVLVEKYAVDPDAHSDAAWIYELEPRRLQTPHHRSR